MEEFWDDLTGEWLDPKMVVRARQEEMEEYYKQKYGKKEEFEKLVLLFDRLR